MLQGLVEANPLTNDGGQLSGKVVVTRDTECSEPCDLEVGQCDERGKCVCNEGRKGTNCSKGKFLELLFQTKPHIFLVCVCVCVCVCS